ncbi:MAG: tetratricopeptide repeat protein, partial [Thermodesulfobacteriota bacterium]
FKVVGKKKELNEGIGKTYHFAEAEKDNWANLFEYRGSEENIRLRFSIDKLEADLDDIVILYEGYQNGEAWKKFISNLRQAERGLELEPNSADVVFGYAFILVYTGGDSIPFFERAMRLNPKPPNLYVRIYAEALRDTGRYEEAIAQLKKAIEREPGDIFSHIFLTAAYSMAGHEKEARAVAAEVFKINPKFSLEQFAEVLPYKNPATKERCINSLRNAGLR